MKRLFFIMALLATVGASAQIPGTIPYLRGYVLQQTTPPSNPVIGQRYQAADGLVYRYDGSIWLVDDIFAQGLALNGTTLELDMYGATDLSVDLSSLAGGGGENLDMFIGVEAVDGYTITDSDCESGRTLFWSDSSTDVEMTLPDVADVGEKFSVWAYGTGKIKIKLDDGVNGTHAQTIDSSNPFTYTKTFSSSVGYLPVGNWEEWSPVTEYYTKYNIASTEDYESNASTDLVGAGMTLAQETTLVADGTMAMRATGTDIVSDRVEFDNITIPADTDVRVYFYAAKQTDASFRAGTWVGFTSSSPTIVETEGSITDSELRLFYIDNTTSSIEENRIIRFYNDSGGVQNTWFIIDGFSIQSR
ncbi:hypothetical protein Q4603_05650 [Zobellia galactanivorans]|uniref:hypothetical protein n=1 Tax=Zobellia galactanivorans (strain DSM 12802 / CCUG 47099 / CIP 106680 / NCIMB 13871 / Dsij) TaxID=63186 RepID=UPI0026E302C0|nr:hypothetical protein [Zobellia galactanivorans]MDO6808079.1 hypothetical protein [Zobellia galactanivorans]